MRASLASARFTCICNLHQQDEEKTNQRYPPSFQFRDIHLVLLLDSLPLRRRGADLHLNQEKHILQQSPEEKNHLLLHFGDDGLKSLQGALALRLLFLAESLVILLQ
jgi:hypothetical protein